MGGGGKKPLVAGKSCFLFDRWYYEKNIILSSSDIDMGRTYSRGRRAPRKIGKRGGLQRDSQTRLLEGQFPGRTTGGLRRGKEIFGRSTITYNERGPTLRRLQGSIERDYSVLRRKKRGSPRSHHTYLEKFPRNEFCARGGEGDF